jgi:tetratricopeptide (TPR) repeat protein
MRSAQSKPFREAISPSSSKRILPLLVLLTAIGPFVCFNVRAQTDFSGTPSLAGSSEMRALDAQETQEIPIALRGGEAVEFDIEQISGQVSLQWRDGAGRESQTLYTLDGVHGHIRGAVVADQPGVWRFAIGTRRARPAQYRVQFGNPRPAVREDAVRASAAQALALGEALRARGAQANATAADEAYRESIALSQEAGDGCGVRAALNGLGHLQIALGQYGAAEASGTRALAERCDDPPAKAHSLRILQAAVQWSGDLDGTIRIGEEALKIYQQTGDLAFQGLILGNLSGAYDQEGATGRAMDAAQRALGLARETQDAEGIVFDEETIGAIHVQRGEYQSALEQFNRTLDDLKTHASPVVQALVEDDLGNVYAALGEHENALAEFRRSQATARAHANPSTELDALVDEGNLHLAKQEYSDAEAAFNRAMVIADGRGVSRKRARALRGVGAAEVGEGHFAAGLRKLLEARDLARSLHDDFTEIEADLDLGDHYFARADFPRAEEAYAQLRELTERSGSASKLATAWASLARVRQASGDLAVARIDAEHALATIEDQRGQINPPDLRSSFFQSTRGYYDLYVQILMGLQQNTGDAGYARLALAAAENSRARALTDLLAEQSISVRNGVPPELLFKRSQAEDALRAAAYRLNRSPPQTGTKDREALEAAVREAKQSLDETEGEIRGANRRYGV